MQLDIQANGLTVGYEHEVISASPAGVQHHFARGQEIIDLSLPRRSTELVWGILASIIVMWFSPQRELRADAGGAQVTGRHAMIAALERLVSLQPPPLPDKMAAFGSSGGGGLKCLLMTPPPPEARIAALKGSSDR